MYKLLKLAFLSLLILCFSACREEDPIMPQEEGGLSKFRTYESIFDNCFSFFLPPKK